MKVQTKNDDVLGLLGPVEVLRMSVGSELPGIGPALPDNMKYQENSVQTADESPVSAPGPVGWPACRKTIPSTL